MEAKFSQRIGAYIFDLIILGLLIFILSTIIPKSKNTKVLNTELDNLNESFLNERVSMKEYANHYAQIMHEVDKENVIYTIVNIIFIIIYFILIPYYFNGQTFGKKLFKIKLAKKNDKVSINDLIIRNLTINGLGYMFVVLALIYILPSLSYFIAIVVLSIIQLVIIILTMIGLLKNNEKLILHDRFTNTTVINT